MAQQTWANLAHTEPVVSGRGVARTDCMLDFRYLINDAVQTILTRARNVGHLTHITDYLPGFQNR